jgi:ABC-2 type transport system permease protein
VTSLVLLGAGNLSSIAYPRAVDPNQMMRNSSGGMVTALLLLLYPVLSIPVSLAYLARWALDSQAAFFAVLAVDLLLAGILYWVATDAAIETAEARKEQMISALTASQREGPISIR